VLLRQSIAIPRRGRPFFETFSETQQSLHLCSILRKTQTNIGISEAKSEFMFANRSFAEQSEQLSAIEHNILTGEELEHPTGMLFTWFPREITGRRLRRELLPAFERHIKRLKGLLLLKELEEKSIEDYNYNVVKVLKVDRETPVRLLGEGGTSRVF
jgi:hypothetical protein